jgi:hypothetical protein
MDCRTTWRSVLLGIDNLSTLTRRYFMVNEIMEYTSRNRENQAENTCQSPPETVVKSENTNTNNKKKYQRDGVHKITLKCQAFHILCVFLHYGISPRILMKYSRGRTLSQSQLTRGEGH